MKRGVRGSNYLTISPLIGVLVELNPHTVIDIGAGDGKYGGLCWEYLPDLEYIDAVEPSGVTTPNADWYRRVYVMNLEQWIPEQRYELGLMTAVIQKLNAEQTEYVRFLRRTVLGRIIITSPKDPKPDFTVEKMTELMQRELLGSWETVEEWITLW